jgi:glycosyltransferase involved in cell wall biosynthesis
MRVLYSFPHKVGAARICQTAWEQIRGTAAAGADITVMSSTLTRPLPAGVNYMPTVARGRWRVPPRVFGTVNVCALHDYIVARRLRKIAGQFDVVHCWPLGALETLRAASEFGVPTVLERPNAYTRFCYETVAKECARVGVQPHHEYTFKQNVLRREEAEFAAADYLLCPSEFVAQSFLEKGFAPSAILHHQYGFDDVGYFPESTKRDPSKPFTALFVGVDAVRKGLHLALQAWLRSPASRDGIFMVAGNVSQDFQQRFAEELKHPSVTLLGHRKDMPELMRKADILVLPSLEEGSPLVCMDAIGSGVVPVVSQACNGSCRHMVNALVHEIGDVDALQQHLTMLYEDRNLLAELRERAIRSRENFTWKAAGVSLLAAYEQAVERYSPAAKSAAVLARQGAPQQSTPVR